MYINLLDNLHGNNTVTDMSNHTFKLLLSTKAVPRISLTFEIHVSITHKILGYKQINICYWKLLLFVKYSIVYTTVTTLNAECMCEIRIYLIN